MIIILMIVNYMVIEIKCYRFDIYLWFKIIKKRELYFNGFFIFFFWFIIFNYVKFVF